MSNIVDSVREIAERRYRRETGTPVEGPIPFEVEDALTLHQAANVLEQNLGKPKREVVIRDDSPIEVVEGFQYAYGSRITLVASDGEPFEIYIDNGTRQRLSDKLRITQ